MTKHSKDNNCDTQEKYHLFIITALPKTDQVALAILYFNNLKFANRSFLNLHTYLKTTGHWVMNKWIINLRDGVYKTELKSEQGCSEMGEMDVNSGNVVCKGSMLFQQKSDPQIDIAMIAADNKILAVNLLRHQEVMLTSDPNILTSSFTLADSKTGKMILTNLFMPDNLPKEYTGRFDDRAAFGT